MDAANIKILLYDTADQAYSNANQFVSDLVAGGIAGARSANLGTKTFTSTGDVFKFTSANTSITACPLGDSMERAIVYYDSGLDATSILIADLALASPITPNGGDITITINASGIVTITCTPA